ncbi:MAG: hypothetical protein A2105_06815 [Omnitrophica WOR_2 bacterium GWF2_63_9]|nr:MAG: hypothetical protein A2105_06815 [Omnitrophica WOR_2 bacterium GWF2_63_9]
MMTDQERVRTWGEIALILGVSVSTAQRYHALAGLPVRKGGGRTSFVVAYRSELAAWLREYDKPLRRLG